MAVSNREAQARLGIHTALPPPQTTDEDHSPLLRTPIWVSIWVRQVHGIPALPKNTKAQGVCLGL
jgi:hypothetical protein